VTLDAIHVLRGKRDMEYCILKKKKNENTVRASTFFERRERSEYRMVPQQTYVSESTIPQSGKGLFATRRITRGSVIAEFKGVLLKPGKGTTNSRSTILFPDGYKLSCDETDQASFANDCICVPPQATRRKLMEALRSTTTPFFQLHPKARLNAQMIVDDKEHRAFLVASKKIRQGEEIFLHYGFAYWFAKEIEEKGFLQEAEIDANGFPESFHQYPAFRNYLKLVFPDMKGIRVSTTSTHSLVTVYFCSSSAETCTIPIPNYKDLIQRVPLSTLPAVPVLE
jgi:hypothetical protein